MGCGPTLHSTQTGCVCVLVSATCVWDTVTMATLVFLYQGHVLCCVVEHCRLCHVRMHIRMYVRTYVCTCIRMHVRMHTLYVRTYVCTCIRMHVRMCIRMYHCMLDKLLM